MDTPLQRILLLLVLVVTFAVLVVAGPVRYDQRQEGDLNVNAHLQNFVILVIPTGGSSSLADLLETLKRASPGLSKKASGQKFKTATVEVESKEEPSNDAEVTAVEVKSDDVLVAESPSVALKHRSEEARVRLLNYGLEVCKPGQCQEAVDPEEKKQTATAELLKRLRMGLEMCKPGERRNADGLCEPIPQKHRSLEPLSKEKLAALQFGLSPANYQD